MTKQNKPEGIVSILSNIQQQSKKEIENYARSNAKKIIEEGFYEPLDSMIYAKRLNTYLNAFMKELTEQVIEDAQANGRGEHKHKSGAKYTVKESGARYDFSNCNHPTWQQVCDQKKNIEEFLKALKEPTTIVNEETGEVCRVYPPVKKSTTTISIQL